MCKDIDSRRPGRGYIGGMQACMYGAMLCQVESPN